jgi:TolB-like protein/DNA-binding winged helix-turn-helix (wHTH) protein/tetratricopeptide (TPR) repeat protein
MPTQKYQFGSFLLRVRTRELFRDGTKLKLRPQAFQVLAVLLERAGDCVTREELQEQVWPGNKLVDAEHGLNTAIKELRACLGDSASKPRYIETLPKLGYRMVPPVEALVETAGEPPQKATSSIGHATEMPKVTVTPADTETRRRWAVSFVVAAAVIVASLIVLKSPWSHAHDVQQVPPAHVRVMLAVLPFENLTGDAAQDYFSDGFTEEMISQLGRLDPQQFGVIARTSVMHYKHTSENMDQIGRELGVQQILEGSVRREAGGVRINAQLIEVSSQSRVWSREYNRETTNLLGVQVEIAEEIANEIQPSLGSPKTGATASKPTLTPRAYQAYDSYLKGLFFWNQRTTTGFQQAIHYFQEAIAKDPDYAPAYAGLANSYTLLTAYSATPASEHMPKARAAAQRALQLDDNLPEAHVAMALILANYDWNWQASEIEYRRGIQLNSNYATGHHWFAELLTWRGRFDEALRESEMARSLDPLSLIIATDRAAIFYYARQYDRAIEEFRAVQDMNPRFPRVHLVINAYVERGRFDEAMMDLENWTRDSGDSGDAGWIIATQAYVYGRSGRADKAQEALGRLEKIATKQQVNTSALIFAHLGVGDKDATMGWLEKAYGQHSNAMTTLKVDPAYDPLRSDARFQDLLQRVGLDK